MESSLASEQLLADQQRYLEAVLSQDSEALRLGRLRYDAGATDLLHVLQIQARQLNSRFELIGIRNDRWPTASRCTWRSAEDFDACALTVTSHVTCAAFVSRSEP